MKKPRSTYTARFTFPSTRAHINYNMYYCDIADKGSWVIILSAYDEFNAEIIHIGKIRIRCTDSNVYAKVWLDLGGEIQGITGSGANCTASYAIRDALAGIGVLDSMDSTDINFQVLAKDLAKHLGLESHSVLDMR